MAKNNTQSITSNKWFIPGIIIGALVLFGMMVAGTYNGLVAAQEKVTTAFSNVQTQYQRRADLIPNLVNTVKGASNFEQETLTKVIDARSKATSITIDPAKTTPEQLKKYQQAQGEVSSALGRLLAVAEQYPQLKATDTYRDLLVQLEGTENRITTARADYNEVARGYNTSVKSFPTNLAAGLFGFGPQAYFEADQGASKSPEVKF